MTLRLSDLSPMQARAMIKLDDGHPHEDSVGQELNAINLLMLSACKQLVRLGLAEVRAGWRKSVWIRLTERGRMVRETGAA